MLRNGRPPDPHFELDDSLYRGFRADEVINGRLIPERIKFYPRMSVNRGKYSEPGDFLYVEYPKYRDCGVAECKVADIPGRLVSEGGPVYEWRLEHTPLEDNYAHSEIVTFKDGIHTLTLDPPKHIKKTVRQILSDRLVVVLEPEMRLDG